MRDVIRSHFKALEYMANGTRSSHGERHELLSVVGKNRSVILEVNFTNNPSCRGVFDCATVKVVDRGQPYETLYTVGFKGSACISFVN